MCDIGSCGAIITEACEEHKLPASDGPSTHKNAVEKRSHNNSPKLTWKASSCNKKDTRVEFSNSFDGLHYAFTFTSALEKVESWIFSRIVESVWWYADYLYMFPHSYCTSLYSSCSLKMTSYISLYSNVAQY